MYKATRTGFFTLACQTGRVHLTEGEPVPSSVRADSIKRFLEIGVIEKIAGKEFVKETKSETPKAEKKAGKPKADKPAPDAPSDEPVE